MSAKPTYEELEQRIKELENDAFERKRAEEELQASEVSYRTLAENLPGLVYRVFILENNRMQFFNDQLQSMTGYKEEELKKGIVCSIDPLILPEEMEKITASVEEAIRRGTHFEVEYRITHRDGDIRYFWERGRPILGGNGKYQYIDGTIFDITERKQAEQEIEESKEKYRGLSDAAFEAVFISEKGICLEQNQMAKRMFGYSDSEAIGRVGTEWISPEDRDAVMNNMRSGYDKPYAVSALRKDGSAFPAMIRGKMMHYKGRDVRVTSLQDITARKEAEEALREPPKPPV